MSFRTVALAPGARLDLDAGADEVALVPLAGAVEVEHAGRSWRVGGRASVFAGLPQALYLPLGARYSVAAADGPARVAICAARAERELEPRLVTEDDYTVEVRGAGNATRQVVTVIPPDFPADRLLVVEVWTPSGNWSSYPPHKHDESRPPEEIRLEETYYYEVEGDGGFAVQRLYSEERGVDRTWTVRDRDLLVVPWGYHTTAAAPGHHLYYLNVLAGEARSLQAHEDPRHAFVRQAWADAATDPRVPFVG